MRLPGRAITGGRTSRPEGSRTVTVNAAVVLVPAASVAVQVTAVTPNGKAAPDGGSHRTVTDPLLSVMSTVYWTTLASRPGSAVTTTLVGTISTGGSWSAT